MIKSYLVLGVLGAAGAFSICDLCRSHRTRQGASLISIASAAVPTGSSPGSAPTPVVEPKTVTLDVEGMTCGGCVIGVRKVLTRLSGVLKTDVSYEKKSAVVTYNPDKVSIEQLIAAIKTLGYKATVAPA